MLELEQLKHNLSQKTVMDQTIKKQKLLLHCRIIKFYIEHGMKFRKLHTVYQLRQSPLSANCI